jgi:hypothetical protein
MPTRLPPFDNAQLIAAADRISDIGYEADPMSGAA